MPINSTSIIDLKEGQEKLKEAKQRALTCKKAVEIPNELAPSSSAYTPIFFTLLKQNVMGQIVDGPYINQA